MIGLLNGLKKRKYLIIIIIILLVGGGYLYQKNNKEKLAKTIKSTVVKQGTLQETLILSGEVKAHQYTQLRFLTSGKLAALKVKKGDIVKKGQFVASLDQRELKKRLTKELNDYKTTRWDFEQGLDDSKDQAIDTAIQRTLDKSQFSLDNAVLDVEIQNISLEYSNLISPIQGLVVNTGNFQPGMNISATDTIVSIINPDSLYFEVTADQTEVTKIREEMQGTLILDAFIEEKIKGEITQIDFSPKTDESGTVYGVEIGFNNSSNQNLKYRLGMTGDVEFILNEKKNALYVPTEYVNDDSEGDYVFIMKNDKKVKQYITKGMETDNSIEIVKGLNKGDLIYD